MEWETASSVAIGDSLTPASSNPIRAISTQCIKTLQRCNLDLKPVQSKHRTRIGAMPGRAKAETASLASTQTNSSTKALLKSVFKSRSKPPPTSPTCSKSTPSTSATSDAKNSDKAQGRQATKAAADDRGAERAIDDGQMRGRMEYFALR